MTGDGGDAPTGGAHEAGEEPREDHFRALLRLCEDELLRTGEPGRAARLLHTCGRLYEERMGDARRAADRYLDAYRIMPGYLPNIRAARRLMADRADWNMVLELLDAELHVTSTSDQKAELHVERGRILEERLAEGERARTAYARALELDERNPDAWRLLARALAAGERWGELDDLYARIASHVTDPVTRAAFMVLRGRLHDEHLGDPTVAAQLYADALEAEPAPAAAVVALKRLHAKSGRWTDLVAVLTREAKLLDEPNTALCHYRIARVYADRLGRIDKALEHLEQVEKLVPDSALALSELAHLYEQSTRYHELARVCLRQLELTRDDSEKLALHHKIGLVCEEHLGDETRAMEHYRMAVELRPAYVPALQALGKLCRKHGSWEQLLEMHLIEADQAPEPQRRALASYRAGEVLETQLERLEEAVEQYQKAQRLVPAFLPALRALDRLYSRLGRWKELIALFETEGESFKGLKAGEAGGEDGLRLARIEQIGSLYEDKIGDLDQAAESFRRILEIDPSHVGAITALERIYEKAERWTELMEILEREAELVEDETWVAALLHKVGEIAEERLGDRDIALLHYRRVLAISPSYVPALTSLGRMYYQQGRWVDLLGMYRKEAEVAPRLEDRVPILFKMGEIYEDKEGNEAEAEECYRQCLEQDPTFPPALRALERIYRRRRDWERLAEILESQAAELRDPLAQAVAYHRVGELWEERLGREQLAWDSYTQALRCNEGFEPARDALARLCVARGAWQDLVAIFEEQLASGSEGYRRVEILAQLAALREERLEDVAGAIEALEQLQELVPNDVGTLLALVELYREEGLWESLAEASGRLAEVAGDFLVKAGAFRELGLTLQDRLSSPRAATEAWEPLLDFRPTDTLALAALERSARSRGDDEALARVIRLQIERAGDPQMDAALRLTLASLLDLAGRPADALGELRRVLLLEPEHFAALEGTRRLAREVGDVEAEVQALRQLAEVAGEPPRRAAMLVQASELMEGAGAAAEELAPLAERALELDPDSLPAAQALERALTSVGDFERLRDHLARAAGRGRDLERMLELHRKVAVVSLEALHDLAGGVAALEKALKLSPDDPMVLDALGELYPQVGRWEESIAVGRQLLDNALDGDILQKARLRQARLEDDKAGALEKAADQLGAVLAQEADNLEAMRRLGSIRARQREWNEALVVFERLAHLEEESFRKVDALLCLAEAHVDGTGDVDSALELLHEALDLGASGESVRDVLEAAFDRRSDGRSLAEGYRRVLADVGEGASAAALDVLGMTLGELLAGDLGDGEGAAAAYRSILARSPSHVDARSRLAAIYGDEGGRSEDAVREHRALLVSDPFRFGSVRALHGLWSEAGQGDRAGLALDVLVAFHTATDQEVADGDRRKSAAEAERPLQRAALRPRLVTGAVPAQALALLDAIEPFLGKLHPPDLATHGLGAGDATAKDDRGPCRRHADQVAHLLGVDAFELYVSRSPGRPGGVEMTDPPAVVLPAGAADLSDRRQLFVLGELMSRLALGTWPTLKLAVGELEALLAAATRIHVEGFGRGHMAEDSLETLRKRLEKALPRRVRKGLAGVATAYADKVGPVYADEDRPNLAAWYEAMDGAARRAGLLACRDPRGALETLKSRDRELEELPSVTSEEMVAVYGQMEQARDLLVWFLSDDHFVLRRMAGLDTP